MTKDVIALTERMPDAATLIAALHAGGPGLGVTATDDGAVIHLCTAAGRPLVSVESPLLVQVPGEAERLLGPDVTPPPTPYWWTEIRASTAVPAAEALAGSVCGRLALLLGGTTWPRRAHGTAVVETPPDDTGRTVSRTPDGALPAVDVLTESTAVVITDRPVLGLTAWLSGVLRATAASGRALHLVTPPHARLTLPLRTALGGPPNRWVVRHPAGGYYDGLTGAQLAWRDGTFTPAFRPAKVADAFTEGVRPTVERRLTVALRTVRPPDAGLVLGTALETAWRHLTGAPPAGWGTAEPVNLPWSPRQLTELARDRSPEPTHAVVIGAPDVPAVATHRTSRTTAGVAEDVTLTVGYPAADRVPLDAVEALAAELVDAHGLSTMLTTLTAADAGLTVAPRLTAPPVPVAFTLGARDVRAVGLAHSRRPPLATRPVPLGTSADPALHYPLGDGTDPAAWAALKALTGHLRVGGA
ncbi:MULTISPECIES: DUF6177 family protein [Streptomyces]|uniref:DUF6177 family protein n=1 Tax=Streptomyces TaxID=1883 RepID=UPI0016721886|nr:MULTISPECIES: DUF6177 family protein [Streptomyces]MBK3522882.1 hypothetical protein [Streptomyces sp. MBT70]GGS11979.1 hypothetical protein GCM10010236_78150 [Streptomyces eurythermus]